MLKNVTFIKFKSAHPMGMTVNFLFFFVNKNLGACWLVHRYSRPAFEENMVEQMTVKELKCRIVQTLSELMKVKQKLRKINLNQCNKYYFVFCYIFVKWDDSENVRFQVGGAEFDSFPPFFQSNFFAADRWRGEWDRRKQNWRKSKVRIWRMDGRRQQWLSIINC